MSSSFFFSHKKQIKWRRCSSSLTELSSSTGGGVSWIICGGESTHKHAWEQTEGRCRYTWEDDKSHKLVYPLRVKAMCSLCATRWLHNNTWLRYWVVFFQQEQCADLEICFPDFFGLRFLIRRIEEESQACKYCYYFLYGTVIISIKHIYTCWFCQIFLLFIYLVSFFLEYDVQLQHWQIVHGQNVFLSMSKSSLSFTIRLLPLYICHHMSCQCVFSPDSLNALGKLSHPDSYLWFSSMLLQMLEHKMIPRGNVAVLFLNRLAFATKWTRTEKVKGGSAML